MNPSKPRLPLSHLNLPTASKPMLWLVALCALVVASSGCGPEPDLTELAQEANKVASAAGLEVTSEQVVRDSSSRMFEHNKPYVELSAVGSDNPAELASAVQTAAKDRGFQLEDVETGADRIYVTLSTNTVRIVAEVRTSVSSPRPVRVAAMAVT